jgi:hypothetical protein
MKVSMAVPRLRPTAGALYSKMNPACVCESFERLLSVPRVHGLKAAREFILRDASRAGPPDAVFDLL